MDVNRRNFIAGALCVGAGVSGCRTLSRMDGPDENLSVFISDLHVGGVNKKLTYTRPRLEKVVNEILAMRPLPMRPMRMILWSWIRRMVLEMPFVRSR